MSSPSSTSSSSSSFTISSSTRPSGSKGFMHMPAELFDHVDSHLSYEDSNNFKSAHPLIDIRLTSNLIYYDKLHLSDDEDDCWISDTRGRVVPRRFNANNASDLFRSLENLKEVTVIMKDVNVKNLQAMGPQNNFTECTPYTPGGYLQKLFGGISPSELHLRQLSLHVDIMVESLEDVYCLVCPTEDLKFSMNELVNAEFNSFIQISICCAQIRPTDETARNYLLNGMQFALKHCNEIGAKTEFVIEPCEGYVDMTVEKGNVEYSFAFFYYNPTICDPTPEDAEMPMITDLSPVV
ncbi:Maelstrom domain-containing protein [Caenorhabditis elegans]|nr:Maelstrom domain-containing protein [Caenorhabditis elegans]CAA98512.2 Maelstrom domain-containing protein [Caenorhabditis elegans]|eukprot:NP_001256310.1 Uncharacterized protein CELE_K10D6.4 [Caenorhabditis elegans]